jgi:CubicO group peptidase (beta-lactamase class C family)
MTAAPTATLVRDPRFDAVEAVMRPHVDGLRLAGVSWAILREREPVDARCIGWADRERGEALRPDHLFRIFSNTKLVTSCATLLLHEAGCFDLDEPIARFVPQLADRRVLRPGATSLDDTEPASRPITIRHLLTHSSGLSYGLLDPGTLLFRAYTVRKVLSAARPLSTMIDTLAQLPLAFHPGTSWEYSVATDVLGHLIEVVSGQRLDAFFTERIFEPLGMVDTGFVVPAHGRDRLSAYYAGADLLDPMKPGLTRLENQPYAGAFLEAVPRLSGGGGLVSSLADMTALIRALLPGGPTLLRPETLAAMFRNHLPEGVWLRFPGMGELEGKGHGLAGAVTVKPSSIDPPNAHGELQWGGIAGTHWWICPSRGIAAVTMAQRAMGFWHPSAFDFKRAVYAAARP